MDQITTSTKKKALLTALLVPIFIVVAHPSFVYSASLQSLDQVLKQPPEKQYFLLLIGFVFFLPEVVELDLKPDGTFSLSSDLWVEPAQGTYEDGVFLLSGSGTTGDFFDPDFEEIIEIQYRFIGVSLGLRDALFLGIGSREFTFEDGLLIPENFIFTGPGF